MLIQLLRELSEVRFSNLLRHDSQQRQIHIFAAAHDSAFQVFQHEDGYSADECAGDQTDQRIDGHIRSGAHGDGIVLQAGFDAVFAARLLVEVVAILHQHLPVFGGYALGLVHILMLDINLDEQAVDIRRDAHIGAQLQWRHVHLQAVNDLGGAQGTIQPGDMVVECLLDSLRQTEVAATGHDEHFLRRAIDGVERAAEEKCRARSDDGEQQHDPAAADENASIVDEVHAGDFTLFCADCAMVATGCAKARIAVFAGRAWDQDSGD